MARVRESVINTEGQVIESTGELVLVEVLDNELPAGAQFVYSERGVRVIGAPTVADFCLEISKAARFGALLHFVIGDLLLAMRRVYGETYAQAASLTGYAPGTITNDVSVASRVPPEVRRLDACTYAHHQAVASLPVEYQKAVLDMAADGAWSTAETNAYVQMVKRANALPELDGLPELPLALAAISTIIIAAFIGLFDDLFALAKRFDGRTGIKRIGLPQWAKPLLMLPAAVPLMAIMAGHTSMTVPLLGAVDFGLAYPLLLVPLAVIGAANATNMLAGLNGLETGLGVVLLGSMGLWAVVTEQPAAAAIALPLSAALAGFLIWNHWPSRILPGDSVSYIIGAAVATVAVIGNMERFAVISFMPWFIELVLKARGRFRAESFGRLRPDGTLESPGKIYSLTHLVMRVGRFKEPQVVAILIGLELLLSVAVWAIYWPIAI